MLLRQQRKTKFQEKDVTIVYDRKKILLTSKIETLSNASVKQEEDKHIPWISGCSILSKGYLVVCDRSNKKIKLLDISLILQRSLKLSSMPWDVSIIDDNNVIVTLPDQQRLQCIQVLPQMNAGRIIQLSRKCYGVDVSGDEIYTTCHDNRGRAEIKVLALNGMIKRQLGVNQDGSFIFTDPHYIAVSKSGRNIIFVSDIGSSTVTCITVKGCIIYQYKDGDLISPQGLYADADDNAIVCGAQSNYVHVLGSDGRNYKTLLSSGDNILVGSPYSVAYRHSDKTLVICCNNDTLFPH